MLSLRRFQVKDGEQAQSTLMFKLAVMIEVCTPIVRENIDIIAPAVFTHMHSTHARVRYAACLVWT